jgi:hypothetical protein
MKAKVRVSLNEDWRTVFDSLSAKLVKNSHLAKFMSKKFKMVSLKNIEL